MEKRKERSCLTRLIQFHGELEVLHALSSV